MQKHPGLSSIWVDNQSIKHYFIDINHQKTWTEYINDKKMTDYRLYVFDESNLILQNQILTDSYVILTKTGYFIRSYKTPSYPKSAQIPGTWFIQPVFPKSITLLLM